MRIRRLGPEGHGKDAVQMAASLLEAGSAPVWITADRPAAVLVRQMRQAGLDPTGIRFLDVVTRTQGEVDVATDGSQVRVLHLGSPTLLEVITLRTERLAREAGPRAHVVVDSLHALALYNGVAGVVEFLHGFLNRMAAQEIPVDLVVPPGDEGEAWVERLRPMLPEPAPRELLATG